MHCESKKVIFMDFDTSHNNIKSSELVFNEDDLKAQLIPNSAMSMVSNEGQEDLKSRFYGKWDQSKPPQKRNQSGHTRPAKRRESSKISHPQPKSTLTHHLTFSKPQGQEPAQDENP